MAGQKSVGVDCTEPMVEVQLSWQNPVQQLWFEGGYVARTEVFASDTQNPHCLLDIIEEKAELFTGR